MSKKIAVVTGSNKGIGFAIVKGLLKRFDGDVYLTSRDDGRGKAAVESLHSLGLHAKYHQLDVTDRKSIEKFRDHIKENYGGIDIIINNAGVANFMEANRILNFEESKYIIDTNFYGILSIQELLFPLLRENGRVLNISSSCGHLSNIRNKYWIEKLSKKDLKIDDIKEFVEWFLDSIKEGTFDRNDIADNGKIASYRVTKVALCALTMLQQKQLESKNISVNSVHPGVVRTDMTRGGGFLNADEAAETPIYLVLDAPESLRGAYVWHNRKVLDWYDYKADYYFKCACLTDSNVDHIEGI